MGITGGIDDASGFEIVREDFQPREKGMMGGRQGVKG